MEFLQSLFWLIVTMTILVGFHEFGHFWVARRAGIQVTRFSIGFGPRLTSRFDRHGTEYQLAALPLGGYVKMLDTREGTVDPADRPRAFDQQSLGKRMAVVAAGPIANIVLTVFIFWLIGMIGQAVYAPRVAAVPQTMSDTGLRAGDLVTALDGVAIDSSDALDTGLLSAVVDRRDATLGVRGTDGVQRLVVLPYSTIPAQTSTPEAMSRYRFLQPRDVMDPIIGSVVEHSPNQGVLQAGDRIVSVQGHPVRYWHEIAQFINQRAADAQPSIQLEIVRGGERLARVVALQRNPTQQRWVMGVMVDPSATQRPAPDKIARLNPFAAIPAALVQTWDATRLMGDMALKAVTGKLELNLTVAGPVTTARVSNAVAKSGVSQYLKLLALLSLSVAILNLLPIPVLDGGHLLYYLIELVKGSPVSERTQALGNAIGLALVFSLMGLALFNDFVNNF